MLEMIGWVHGIKQEVKMDCLKQDGRKCACRFAKKLLLVTSM